MRMMQATSTPSPTAARVISGWDSPSIETIGTVKRKKISTIKTYVLSSVHSKLNKWLTIFSLIPANDKLPAIFHFIPCFKLIDVVKTSSGRRFPWDTVGCVVACVLKMEKSRGSFHRSMTNVCQCAMHQNATVSLTQLLNKVVVASLQTVLCVFFSSMGESYMYMESCSGNVRGCLI